MTRDEPVWRKSSKSNGSGECLEWARLDEDTVGVRDSKDPDGAVLRFSAGEWRAFVDDVRKGEIGP